MPETLALLPTAGSSITGVLEHAERNARGEFTAVTILTDAGTIRVPFDHPDLARDADRELRDFFARHPNTRPGITIARDVDSAARIGDLAAGERAQIAWVFVLRHTPPEPAPLNESSVWRPYPSSVEFTQATWDAAVAAAPLPPRPEGHGHATRDG
ncbi:hypothetical protein [Pseudoclavibacter sp. Z016]|uniref:hypothetical protein n=1 Tax=Pseudoclavibacter sp. Z016 TaxID=2080581 RepID=UPI000CE7DB8C|nr:hypothetical protein [Pseudoclavibacter sp. Z016]PPF72609.1 hypothetical protein C5B99_17365 [Pseudoclavibacter sp. Z016]